MGVVRHPNSGAGRIKDDGHDENYLYEVKDVGKSLTVKVSDMIGLHRRATRQGRVGVYLFVLDGTDLVVQAKIVHKSQVEGLD